MNKILNLTDYKDNLMFVSDIHWNHDREFLWGARGFKSMQHYKDWFLEQWSEHITEDTVVINLGDVTFSDPKGSEFRRIANLPCKEHHIFNGNHCSGMKQFYQSCLPSKAALETHNPIGAENIIDSLNCEIYPLIHRNENANVTFQGYQRWARVGKQEMTLAHMPHQTWEHMNEKYNGGAWMLSGHSHGTHDDRNPHSNNKFGKSVDIGVDNAMIQNGSPFFSYEEIKKIMEDRKATMIDHH